MAAGREIERKFLLTAVPEGHGPGTRISQGYLPLASEGTEVRVRRKGHATVLTVKRGSGLDRGEDEVEIDAAVFDALWPLTEGKRVEKTRYELRYEGATIEIDEFAGDLEGLMVAEVEFDSKQASERFAAPDWFGKEVTADESYGNHVLAQRGLPAGRGPPG